MQRRGFLAAATDGSLLGSPLAPPADAQSSAAEIDGRDPARMAVKGGHFCPEEKPNDTAVLIDRFLRR